MTDNTCGLIALSIFLATSPACSGEPRGEVQSVTLDSAGVIVVTSEGSGRGGGEPWSLSASPVLSIGAVDGPEEYQLFHVTNALRRPDGSIVVANDGTRELRFFDANGNFVGAVGAEGSGPGEFAQVSLLHRYRGDSLLVFDAQSNRFSVFSRAGALGRTSHIEAPRPNQPLSLVFGNTRSGQLLVQVTNPLAAGGPGVTRTPQYLYSFDPDGRVGQLVGEFPGFEFYRGAGPMAFGAVPFGRMTIATAYGEGLLVGSTDSFAVKVLATDGSLSRVIRREHSPVPVTAEHIRRNKEERRARLSATPRMFRRAQEDLIDEIPFPEYFPAFEDLRTDPENNIWVGDYNPPGTSGRRYLIFDAAGIPVASVTFPEGFRIFDIGSNYVLGGSEDELGVEYVQLYDLNK